MKSLVTHFPAPEADTGELCPFSLYLVVRAFAEALLLLLLTLLPAVTIALDLRWLQNGVSELSITELLQESLLVAIVCRFIWFGYKNQRDRSALWLLASFYGCLFIRELDLFFDLIEHGFWKWPALLLSLWGLAQAYHGGKDRLIHTFSWVVSSRGFVVMVIGLALVAGFSRIFGSGALIWNHLLQHDQAFEIKSALQEGVELLGYLYIFYGIMLIGPIRNSQLEG